MVETAPATPALFQASEEVAQERRDEADKGRAAAPGTEAQNGSERVPWWRRMFGG